MAKRLNKGFLVALTAVLVALGGTAFVVQKLRSGPDPRKHLLAARKFVEQNNFEGAWAEYTVAWNMDRSNKEICVERGDLANRLTEDQRGQAIGLARGCWDNALEIDPHYLPALNRLLDSYIQQLDYSALFPSESPYDKLKENASRVMLEDPANLRAQAYTFIADLEKWQAGFGTADKKLLATIQSLADLQKKNLADADALFYLGHAKIRLARDARLAGDNDKADALVVELRTLLDATTKAQPDNAMVNYRAYFIYLTLPSLTVGSKVEAAAFDRDLAGDAITRALGAAKPGDTFYDDMRATASDWAMRQQKPDEAEQILRKDYERQPNHLAFRIRLAMLLGRLGNSEKRDEAIRMLEAPMVSQHEPGFPGVTAKLVQRQARIDLVRMRIDKYRLLTDPKARTELIAKIDDGFKQVSSEVIGENIELLRLKAAVQQAKNQDSFALESLRRAVTLMEHMGTKPAFQYDMLYELATAYRRMNQNAAAEERFQQVLRGADTFAPARINLIELYLEENNTSEAEAQLKILAVQQPNLPELPRLRLQYARAKKNPGDGTTNADEINQAYAQIPEDTDLAREFKAEQALKLQNWADAARLLEVLNKEKTGDARISLLLGYAYFQQGQKEDAKSLLGDALAKNPKDSNLKLLLQQVNGATKEEMQKFVEQEITTKTDPLSKELADAKANAIKGDFAGALQHLKNIDAVKPDDPSVASLYFDIYIAKRDYDSANKIIDDRIARLDVDTAGGAYYRWKLAMAQGLFDQAIGFAHDMIDKHGGLSWPWEFLGKTYQASGRFNDAKVQYQKALDIKSQSTVAAIGLAECFYALGQPIQAKEALLNIFQKVPNDQQVRELLMMHAIDRDNRAAAVIPEREKNLAARPNDPESYFALAYACMAAANQSLAVDPKATEQLTVKARGVLSQGVAKFPNNLKLNAKLAELVQKTGDFDAGLDVLKQMASLDIYKDQPQPLLLISKYFTDGQRLDEAEQYLRQAFAISKNDVDIQMALGQQLMDRQKFDAVLELAKVNASHPRVVRMRLQALVLAKRLDEAEKGLAQALAVDDSSSDLWLLQLGIYVDQFRYGEARKVLPRIFKIDPTSSGGLFFQALTELRDPNGGNLELAANSLNTVIARDPNYIDARLQLVEVYNKRRDYESASAQLEEILKRRPENREVRAKLLQVYMDGEKWKRFEGAIQTAELNPVLNSDPVWYRVHAMALARQKLFPQAKEKILDAMRLDRLNDPQYERDYLSIILQSGDNDSVLSESDKLLNNGRKPWWAYLTRGLARTAAGDKTKAAEEFDLALAAADSAKDADAATEVVRNIGQSLGTEQALQRIAGRIDKENRWRLLAVELRMNNSDWTGVVQALQPLLAKIDALSPTERIQTVQFAAQAYHRTGQIQIAKGYYLQWLDKNPLDRIALNNLAYLLAEDKPDGLNTPAAAKEYSQRAFDAEKRNGTQDPNITDTHGWVLTLCGGSDAEQGMNILRGLVDDHSLDPGINEFRYHLGMALIKTKQPDMARVELQKVAEKLQNLTGSAAQSSAQLKTQVMAAIKKADDMVAGKVSSSDR